MGRRPFLLFLAAAALFAACEDDFTPKSDFRKQLAVFAVLDPAMAVQTVRLEWSYDAAVGAISSPLTETEVAEAEVKIVQGGSTFVFSDTVVTNAAGTRVRAWINRELRPQSERSYRLTVTVPGHDPVTSTIVLPSRLYVRADPVRPDTGVATIRAYHGVTTFTNPPAAFYYRAWLEVVKWNFGDTLRQRVEIPLYHSEATGTWTYTSPSREEEQIWSTNMLRYMADQIIAAEDSVLAKRVHVTCYGLEQQFYSYYKIVRGFEDPLSVRLDSPDVSFIEGGLGVFGGVVSDSVEYNYYRFIRD